MYKKYSFEFSKIYKRLMELEIVIRQGLLHSINLNYGDEGYDIFSAFFLNENIKKKYEKYNLKFIRALVFFEVHLGCSIHKLHFLEKFNKKPSTSDILIALYTIEPQLFYKGNNDRLLLDLFDDIAVINGWNYNNLPSPWTIFRQKYALMKNKGKI